MWSIELVTVHLFYGALFIKEGDCWICMELMETSLDKFYNYVFDKLKQRIPENILGEVTVVTLKALNYLKDELKIINRPLDLIKLLRQAFSNSGRRAKSGPRRP